MSAAGVPVQGYKVALGFPGPSLSFAAARGLHTFTVGRHEVTLLNSPLAAWDAFNVLWVDALNMAAAGEISHFAMLHADSDVDPGWGDILLDICDRHQADAVSVIVPIKDARGIANCGIGDLDDSCFDGQAGFLAPVGYDAVHNLGSHDRAGRDIV